LRLSLGRSLECGVQLRERDVVAAVAGPQKARKLQSFATARQNLARVYLPRCRVLHSGVRKRGYRAMTVVLKYARSQLILETPPHAVWEQQRTVGSQVRVVFEQTHDLFTQHRVLVVLARAGRVCEGAYCPPLVGVKKTEHDRGLVPAALLVVGAASTDNLHHLDVLTIKPRRQQLATLARVCVVLAGAVPALAQTRNVLVVATGCLALHIQQLLQRVRVPHQQVASVSFIEHEEARAPECLICPQLLLLFRWNGVRLIAACAQADTLQPAGSSGVGRKFK
jgi:hypothetical protein